MNPYASLNEEHRKAREEKIAQQFGEQSREATHPPDERSQQQRPMELDAPEKSQLKQPQRGSYVTDLRYTPEGLRTHRYQPAQQAEQAQEPAVAKSQEYRSIGGEISTRAERFKAFQERRAQQQREMEQEQGQGY